MLTDLYIRLRSLFQRSTVEEELDDELRFHLERQVDKYVQAGMDLEQARRRAGLEFGGLSQVADDCRQARGITLAETLAQDLRFGVRVLRKSPGFTMVVILTLALGIGANIAIFTMVNAVLLQSLPVMDPQHLVVVQWSARTWGNGGTSSFGDCEHVQSRNGEENTGCSLPYVTFQEIRGQKDVFSNAMAFAGPGGLDLSGNGAATIAQGELVSGNYFETLGVGAVLGRTLQAADEIPGAAAVAVLDYQYWRNAFGGSPTAVGKTIHLNNVAFTIVGIADPEFTRLTPGKSVDLWVPLTQVKALGLPWGGDGGDPSWWLAVVGRLKPGVSRMQAQGTVNALVVNQALHGEKPRWKAEDHPHVSLVPAEKGLTGFRDDFGKPLVLLMAACGIVLLITCANVAGLLLVRGAAREKEIAVRLAMGAGWRRIMRQLLTESLLFSCAGGLGGAGLAYLGATSLATFFSKNAYSPLRLNLAPNVPVLLFTVAAAVMTGVGFGLAPAFRGARANVSSELKGSSTTTTAQRGVGRFSLGNGLVVVQVALSMVVLTGAGLLLRTLDKLHRVDPGFDTNNILLFSINPALAGYRSEDIPILYQSLQRRLESLPGVVETSYSSGALLDGGLWTRSTQMAGPKGKDNVKTQMLAVGPDFFRTMKIPLLDGRVFQAADMGGANHVAVVNKAFVRKFVDASNPIGLHLGGADAKDPKYQIVGVVADTKYAGLQDENAPTTYIPLIEGGATFTVRAAASPTGLMRAVRNAVTEIDGNLPVTQMRTQSETIDRLLFNQRLLTRLFGLFGALGLILAAIGLYGLLSYEVTRRTREIGIRTALGAPKLDVLILVLRQGLALVLLGVTAGCGAAWGVTRLLHSLLFEVGPTDPTTFSLVAALLLAVGTIACFMPARRASRVDPMTALRCE